MKTSLKNPDVIKKIQSVVDELNTQFNHVEQIKKFELLPAEWSLDTGEMTPKMSLKRKVVLEKFKDIIDRIYYKIGNSYSKRYLAFASLFTILFFLLFQQLIQFIQVWRKNNFCSPVSCASFRCTVCINRIVPCMA